MLRNLNTNPGYTVDTVFIRAQKPNSSNIFLPCNACAVMFS